MPTPECPQCHSQIAVGQEDDLSSVACENCGCRVTLEMTRDETGQMRAQTLVPAGRPTARKDGRLPKKIGPYRIVDRLGAGGMGVVLLARDPILKRDVALKILSGRFLKDKERVERFVAEASAAAKLTHPNVAIVFQAGVDGKYAFIAMEYIDGPSLDKLVAETGQIPWREATQAIRDAAAGLEAAHEVDLVHRDIKPANLIRNDKGQTKVVDFGLVRALDEQSHGNVTQQGRLLGTPAFMAPEQWTHAPVDGRTDLYALTCSYYNLLAGKNPFEAKSFPALGYQHRYEPFPALDAAIDVPEGVREILRRGSAKDPAERYQTATEMMADLDRVLEGKTAPLPLPSAPPVVRVKEKPKRRALALPDWRRLTTPPVIGTAVAALFLMLVFGVILAIRTPKGTVRIEIPSDAEDVEVTVDGETIHIDGLDDPLELTVGEHQLEVKSSNFRLYTQSFELARGENEPLKVTLAPMSTSPPSLNLSLSARHVLTGPRGHVHRGSISSDGKLLVAPYYANGTGAVIWNLETGREVQRFDGFTNACTLSATFSPDDCLLAIAGEDDIIHICDAATGEKQFDFRGHKGNVWSTVFTPDGNRLISGSSDQTIKIWNMDTRQLEATLTGHTTPLRQVALSPDGNLLASGGEDGLVKLWNLSTRSEAATLVCGSGGGKQYFEFSSDGKRLFANGHHSGRHDELILWDIVTQRELWRTSSGQDWTSRVTFSPDDRIVACGGSGRRVLLFDASTGDRLGAFSGHTDAILNVLFTPDGKTLASGSMDHTIRVWDVEINEGKLKDDASPQVASSTHPIRVSASPDLSPAPGTLIWHDDFNADRLAGYSKTLPSNPSKWNVENGVLRHKYGPRKQDEEDLLLPFELSGDVIVEYRVAPQGGRANDANFTVDGLAFVYGGNANQQSWIGLYNVERSEKGRSPVWIDRTNVTTVRLECFGDKAKMLIDGRVVRTAEYACPPRKTPAPVGFSGSHVGPDVGYDYLTVRRPTLEEYEAAGVEPVGDAVAIDRSNISDDVWAIVQEIDRIPGEPLFGQTESLRGRLLTILAERPGTGDALVAADQLARLPSPFDRLRREEIAPYELTVAGGGDASNTPSELVTIIGDSRLKHWYDCRIVGFTPDSRTLVTATGKNLGPMFAWDVATGKELRRLSGGNGSADHALSLQGDRLALGDADGTVRIVDFATGRVLHTMKGHTSNIWRLCFSRDGRFLATPSEDSLIKIWDVATGKELRTLTGHRGPAVSVDFSPDSQTLASIGNDGEMRVWDLASGNVKTKTQIGLGRCIRYSRDGRLLAAGNTKGELRVWNASSLELLHTLKTNGDSGELKCVAFTPDGKMIVAGYDHGAIRFWDPAKGSDLFSNNLLVQPYKYRPVNRVQVSPDGRLLAAAIGGGGVQIWDLKTRKPVHNLDGHTAGLRLSALSIDGMTLVSADNNAKYLAWDAVSGRLMQEMQQLWLHPRAVDFASDGRVLTAEQTSGGCIRVWEMQDGVMKQVHRFGTKWPYITRFSSSGEYIAAKKHPDGLVVWDARSGEKLSALPDQKAHLRLLAFKPGEEAICSGVPGKNGTGTLDLYEVPTLRKLRTIGSWSGGLFQITFSPDGTLLAGGAHEEPKVTVWGVATGETRTIIPLEDGGRENVVAFSLDGKKLAAAGDAGVVYVCDAASGEVLRKVRIADHPAPVKMLRFTPDGRHLVTANANGTFYILRIDDWGGE